MKAIVIKENLEVEIVNIDKEKGVEEIAGIIGGPLEVPYLGDVFTGFNLVPIVNEYGKIKKLPPTVAIVGEDGRIQEMLAGNVVILSDAGDGELKGVDETQAFLFLASIELSPKMVVTSKTTKKEFDCFAIPFKIDMNK